MRSQENQQFDDLTKLTHAEQLEAMPAWEKRDIELLSDILPQHYQPSAKPLAMVVGISASREATVLREVHATQFDIDPSDMKVAGCTITNVPRDFPFMGDLDCTFTGPMEGDATQGATWAMACLELQTEKYRYDSVYIRHPDFVDMRAWTIIHLRALENLEPDGVVITLSRQGDGQKCDDMIEILESEYGVKPRLVQKIENSSERSTQNHDRLVLFKKAV